MKPTALRPGDRIMNRRSPRPIVWTFVRRVPGQAGRPAHCVLQSDLCRGQNGPSDEGLAVASDYDISRHFERVTPSATARRRVG